MFCHDFYWKVQECSKYNSGNKMTIYVKNSKQL